MNFIDLITNPAVIFYCLSQGLFVGWITFLVLTFTNKEEKETKQ